MTVEQPWLLYPIGHLDVDPENVITFEGFLPQTNCDDPLLRLRGLVTIEFFNCARSFARLFRSDRARATEVAERIRTFLQSRSL